MEIKREKLLQKALKWRQKALTETKKISIGLEGQKCLWEGNIVAFRPTETLLRNIAIQVMTHNRHSYFSTFLYFSLDVVKFSKIILLKWHIVREACLDRETSRSPLPGWGSTPEEDIVIYFFLLIQSATFRCCLRILCISKYVPDLLQKSVLKACDVPCDKLHKKAGKSKTWRTWA